MKKTIIRELVEILETKTLRRKELVREIWRINNRTDPVMESAWSTNITKLVYAGVFRRHSKIGYWCIPGTSEQKTFFTHVHTKLRLDSIESEDLRHPVIKKYVEENAHLFI